MGGGFSNSMNKSNSDSHATQFGSEVWNQQSPYLMDIYNQAAALNRANPNGMQQFYQGQQQLGQAGGAFDQSGQQLGQAGQYLQASQGGINAANQGFGQSMQNLQGMANPNQVDPMMDVYARQLGQQLNEQILPGMRGEAAVAGQLGSSRAQIGQALATSRTGQQLQDFGAQLYSDQQNRALAANQGLQQGAAGYLQGAGMMQNIGQGMGQIAQGYQGLGQGYGQNAALYGDFAQLGGQLPWQSLQNYSALIGGPQSIDRGGQSTTRARSWGGSMAGNASIMGG